MGAKNPKTVTIYGRLSFPVFQYDEAVKRDATSQYAKADKSEVKPGFNLLVEQSQLDKLIDHVTTEYLPFVLDRSKAGEKKEALDDAEVKKILKVINGKDWDDQPPYIPIKTVGEKTAKLAPEAVASIKVTGNAGQDIELKAIVNNEDELRVPDPDILQYPIIKPISATVHDMYPGAYVAATLNLYSFVSGKLPGFSAGASVAVFKADGDRLGGGVAVDEDDIFLD